VLDLADALLLQQEATLIGRKEFSVIALIEGP
jgi:hypothetical protein